MKLLGVSKRYGDLVLFDCMDFTAGAAEVTCLLGPSGSGKTTMLNMLSSLVHPDDGRVERPERISCVFQEPRLLPWSTVRENAAYAMDHRMPPGEKSDRIDAVLESMELTEAAYKYPSEISGGMARRCALARALAAPSDAMLMDEPLSSLDPDLRSRILQRLPAFLEGKSVVLVTHDYGTALSLSHRIYRLSDPPVQISPVEKKDLGTIIRQIEDEDLAGD